MTRTETALIRPFSDLEVIDQSLGAVRLIFDDSEFAAGPVVMPADSLAEAGIRVTLPDPAYVRSRIEMTNVPAVDCGLVVIGFSRTHRVSHVFVQEYVKSGWSTVVELDREQAALVLSDRAGFTLIVAVVLLHDLQPAPLRPYMAGTWLSRRTFSVAPEMQEASFSPEELTDEVRTQYSLRDGVLRFIHVGDWTEADVLSDEVRVYLDKDTLNLLLANPDSSASVQLQVELAVLATEMVASTIARGISDGAKKPTPSDLEPFEAAKRFFDTISRKLNLSVSESLDLAFHDSSTLRAHFESAFDLRSVTVQALKES